MNCINKLNPKDRSIMSTTSKEEQPEWSKLGDGKKIAKMTGINTVYNFRKEDILNGGQGAPLAPIYHQMIINSVKIEQPAIFLNLGGIANINL